MALLHTKNLLKKPNFHLKSYLSLWSPLAEAFNTSPMPKHTYQVPKDTGLFNIPQLATPEGFHMLKQNCLQKTEDLINEAFQDANRRKMVQIFDDMSDNLCQVADLAEFIRLAHPDNHFRNAAEDACCTVSGIVEKLNTNVELYKALKLCTEESNNEVDRYVGKLFLLDSEQCGIHLPESDRNKVVQLSDEILQIGQQFAAGTSTPRVIKKSDLPAGVRNVFISDSNDVVITGLLTDSPDPIAREIAYRIFLYPDQKQEFLLKKLLESRNILAKVCGFQTYAHRALRGAVVDDPDKVMQFLRTVSENIWNKALKDFDLMKVMKGGAIGAWDVPYYTQKAKRESFKVSFKEYSPYFSLGACMEGLNIIFENLYNVRLINTEVTPGETWSQDVYKLEVVHGNEGLLGYIYCDFYDRTSKPNQDCHFTIRGGRNLSDGTYQLPIVVLMLNLPTPRWSNPSLLTPNMVDNLFHEMGHAMHSMLARTGYQHVSGTRCSTDFAEVPSILMEYFASDPRVLKTFAKHFQTQEPIPDEMLRRLCGSKRLFNASETQLQIFYSALDQIYHGKHPLNGSTTEILSEVQSEFYCLPYVENTAWQLRFSHLVGYGAKYYAYLVSRSLAYAIWQKYFESDPLNMSNGEKYRFECLAHGGGKDPQKLIEDFLKFKPKSDILAKFVVDEIDFSQIKQI